MSDFISKPFTMKKLYETLVTATGGVAREDRVDPPAAAEDETVAAPADPPAAAADATGELSLPVLDAAQIRELRSLGRPQIVQQAIALFQKQALRNLDELEAACAAGSFEDVERIAHALKSASLSVGGRRFAAVAGECEQASKRGALDTARRLAAQLRPEHATLCTALGEVALGGSEAA
jgi:two-component system sensor histidine kinase BarA